MSHKYAPPSPEIAIQARGIALLLKRQGESYSHIARVIDDTYGWAVHKSNVGRWFDDKGDLIPPPMEKQPVVITGKPIDAMAGYRRISAESLDLNHELKSAVANAFELIDFVYTYARAHSGEDRANFAQYAVPHMGAVAKLLASIPKDETKGTEGLDPALQDFLEGFKEDEN